ncbi:hypothetical protein ACTJI2_13550 [Pseudoxanthomonas sp. 22568]|uniref:hypothetical protein n=1 Tax=Pseudoxanthomonas sp. 22568 TaxID=3453945 RepID=UPI003F83B328
MSTAPTKLDQLPTEWVALAKRYANSAVEFDHGKATAFQACASALKRSLNVVAAPEATPARAWIVEGLKRSFFTRSLKPFRKVVLDYPADAEAKGYLITPLYADAAPGQARPPVATEIAV